MKEINYKSVKSHMDFNKLSGQHQFFNKSKMTA